MRVVMISTDRKILIPGSAVRERMAQYGSLFGELHIVLLCLASTDSSAAQIAPNVFVHPTNSGSAFSYVWSAISVGRTVLSEVYFGQTAITTQDPFETGIVGVVLKKISGFPLQIQLHTDAWSVHFQYGSFLNWIRVTLIAPITFRFATKVRVVSEKIRSDVILHTHVAPKNISVLPIFIDIDWYKGEPRGVDLHVQYPQWKTIILMSSRLTAEKNISTALRVCKKLVGMYPDLGLVIVGQGPQEKKLHTAVGKLRLQENVAFESWQNDLSSYFQTADIFLNTSIYEGYGMTIVEAGASGTAVVTTNVGVAFDLLQDGKNAFVCPVGDQHCMFNKLTTLIENPHIRRMMGKQLQDDVSRVVLSKSEYQKQFKEGIESLNSAQ